MEHWCRCHYLNEETINLLKHRGRSTLESIKNMTKNDIDNLNLSMGQKAALRHALRSENAQTWIQEMNIPETEGIDFGWIQYITELFILCDGCGTDPIVGTRFVCTQCDNFDYCTMCFYTRNHKDHLFNRIDSPGTAPIYAGKSGKGRLTENERFY
ncbi:tetratricopeptide repeat protein 32 isoform X1 [Chiloscyllium plagiosum]|uniref:tetratricopeptide repeat protein 32 isoform X1 n=1 Tax=Chiloscyllium plagiosum TaxID=36176 RepID=UPI001CB869E4|nr:tetratricopeptide repeat protein 32 isoform X1 [Chiloscyllium plagiosum]